MNHIESLVRTIYSPESSPDKIYQAQRELQLEQKSDHGWELAHALLLSANSQAQFLGAQTFIVKLNDRTNLPPADQQQRDLLGWLVRARDNGYMPYVTRKLLGAIIKLYFANNEWPNCPFEVVEILGTDSALCFEFLTFLIEDSELPSGDLRLKLVPKVSQMVYNIIQSSNMSTESSLKTFEVWSLAFFDQFKELLHGLIEISVQLFRNYINDSNSSSEIDDLESAILRVLSDLYTNDWRSWSPLSRRRLTEVLLEMADSCSALSPHELIDNEIFLGVVRLALSVCQEDFSSSTELHPFLARMAGIQLPLVEDVLSSEILDFWNQYTEEVISSGLSTSTSTEASTVIAPVISSYWPRIKIHPDLKPSDWPEFSTFRKDFADFLELSYPILGTQLFDHLTQVIISSLNAQTIDWYEIEAAIFCLNGLSDIIGEDYRGEKPEFRNVQRIFQSDLWAKLPLCENFRVRQTAVNLIGCFVDFFLSDEGEPYLAVTLNYLFTCLGSKSLQNTASRSIQKICDVCRVKLVNEISAFLTIYGQIRFTLDSVPHVRTVGGITCVIQCLKTLEDQAASLSQLLGLVTTALPPESSPENPLEGQHTILKCVATIGKNFQTSASTMNIKNSGSEGPINPDAVFWQQNEIALGIEQTIRNIIWEGLGFSDFTSVEIVCNIVKSGMAQDIGPFVQSEEFTISFITSMSNSATPATITPVLDLAKFYIMSMTARMRQHGKPAMTKDSLSQIFAMVLRHSDSASAVLDILTQLVPLSRALNTTFSQLDENSHAAILIAISGISSSDRFVLRSTATFWKEYLSAPSPVSRADEQTLDLNIANILVQALLLEVSGSASRSDLGTITHIFKALIAHHPFVATNMLKQHVVDSPLNEVIKNQDIKTRQAFVSQLFLVKTTRKMLDVIQKFWLSCRGIPYSYQPQIVEYL